MTMAIMRFAGDIVRDRFGAINTLRFCTSIAIIGMVIVGLFEPPLRSDLWLCHLRYRHF